MELQTKKEIVQALLNYMAEHNMTQADVAQRTKVRKEYISIILKPESNFMYDAGGSQGFIPIKYFNALADLCGFKTEPTFWQLQPTDQTNSILANLKDAKENHLTITIIGETGAGKSFTSKLFASKNPIDTFIITAGASDTLNDLINKMVDELDTPTNGSSKSTKIRGIVRRIETLRSYGRKPMIIIDEAEYLKQPALCAVKELYDNVNEFCSIVLIGTDQLVYNIERLKCRNKPGIPQFHRRIKFGLRILPNIDRSFKLFINDIEDRDLKKFLLANCGNYGELHDVIVPVTREAERLREPISMELVRKVLNLPDGNLIW